MDFKYDCVITKLFHGYHNDECHLTGLIYQFSQNEAKLILSVIFITLLTTILVTIFIIPDKYKKLYEGLKRKLLICDTCVSQKLKKLSVLEDGMYPAPLTIYVHHNLEKSNNSILLESENAKCRIIESLNIDENQSSFVVYVELRKCSYSKFYKITS